MLPMCGISIMVAPFGFYVGETKQVNVNSLRHGPFALHDKLISRFTQLIVMNMLI